MRAPQYRRKGWRSSHETCARKLRYVSEVDAKIAAVKNERRAGVPLHVYRCNVCDGWHCTKMPQSEVTS